MDKYLKLKLDVIIKSCEDAYENYDELHINNKNSKILLDVLKGCKEIL